MLGHRKRRRNVRDASASIHVPLLDGLENGVEHIFDQSSPEALRVDLLPKSDHYQIRARDDKEDLIARTGPHKGIFGNLSPDSVGIDPPT